MSSDFANLLSANWSEVDWIWIIITAIVVMFVLYYLIQWVRSVRGYSDSADDSVKGCLEAVGWGCMIPLTVVVLIATVAVT